ncbi:hypothetical protein Taro_054561, partial [Colocasia esculenta]|nr:hypothetical protein [Colocasia esculenta]
MTRGNIKITTSQKTSKKMISYATRRPLEATPERTQTRVRLQITLKKSGCTRTLPLDEVGNTADGEQWDQDLSALIP